MDPMREHAKEKKQGMFREIPYADSASARLFLEDCVEGLRRRLKPASVSVVVTSPPYNLGIRYGNYDDTIPREQYLQWMELWAREIKQVLQPDGSLFLNMGSKPTDPWVPFEVILRLREHFHLQNVIHWIKSIYVDQVSYGRRIVANVGHYKPVNSPRYLNDCHEYIFHFTLHGDVALDRLAIGVPYKDGSNMNRWKGAHGGIRCRGNCWYIPYETIKDRARDRPHPASFPPKLAEMCIRLHGMKGMQLVLDPFMGIGNTAVACMELGVNFVGFEIDLSYFETAHKRLLHTRTNLMGGKG